MPAGELPATLQLAPGDCRPVALSEGVAVRLLPGSNPGRGELLPGGAYEICVAADGEGLDLSRINLGPTLISGTAGASGTAGLSGRRSALDGQGVIKVKIYTDDDELRRRPVWEADLKARVEQASQVLEAHCGLSLEVVGVGTWDSDDQQQDFERSLREFEREVRPDPADVAIGFTSQYQVVRGRYHMGGTRGPLHPHILLKERARGIMDTERLELLVHELGHFLGAVHSAEPQSVMRPLLNRGPQRQAGARLQFDPANTLLMSLVGAEFKFHGARRMADFTPQTRRQMQVIYRHLEQALPTDSAATQVQRLTASAGAVQLIDQTRSVLERIVAAAEVRREQAARFAAGEGAPPPTGDALLSHYVQIAAIASRELQPETAPQALLLALGIALDDTLTLRKAPLTGVFVQRVESDVERQRRLAVLGEPTLGKRADLAKHFFVSAHAATLVGSRAAKTAGVAKEVLDSQGGTGFSFVDLAANQAGIAFAGALLGKRLTVAQLADSFAGSDFLPPLDGLAEGLSAAALAEQYGGVNDPRLTAELRRIELAVQGLPIYRSGP
jgi:hypothetical protein